MWEVNWFKKTFIYPYRCHGFYIRNEQIIKNYSYYAEGDSKLYQEMFGWLRENMGVARYSILVVDYSHDPIYGSDEIDALFFKTEADLMAFKLIFYEHL